MPQLNTQLQNSQTQQYFNSETVLAFNILNPYSFFRFAVPKPKLEQENFNKKT